MKNLSNVKSTHLRPGSAALFCLFLLIFIASCATVKKEKGQLNLHHAFPNENIPRTHLAIALVSPEFSRSEKRHIVTFRDTLRGAFNNALQELITKKGFNIKGPYSTFDDMAYGEKESAYLAMIPVLTVIIEKTGVEDCSRVPTLCTDQGDILVTGEMRLDFIEPLTKEKVLVKRVNLSDLAIRKPYIAQRRARGKGTSRDGSNYSYSLDDVVGDIITAKKELKNDFEKALADAVSEFYSKSTNKIWSMTSTKELMSYQAQIKKLKGLKRF